MFGSYSCLRHVEAPVHDMAVHDDVEAEAESDCTEGC